ncbi:MAG: hypothetical protein IJS66_00875 [Bacteroidales bacterium]|nr:hypothetical protein [Bacteroidales bacterium]
MKKLIILLTMSLAVLPLKAQEAREYLPKWQKGYFDIHFIATGRGDASFIVMPDGTTMLADAGHLNDGWHVAQPNDSLRPSEWIVKYIRDFSAGLPHRDTVDYFYLTHYHGDHCGIQSVSLPGKHGYRLAGITEIGEYIHFNTIIDRECGEWKFPSEEYMSKREKFIQESYFPFCKYQRDSCGTVLEKFKIGSRTQFRPRNDTKSFRKNFEVYNIASNGHIHTGKGFKAVKMYDEDPTTFDENMFSSVVLFRYGKFTYYNGGDIGSGPHESFSAQHRDFESPVADLIGGHVTVLNPDHHGWKESSNAYFLRKLTPDVIVEMCSNRTHPYAKTLERWIDPMTYGFNHKPKLYITTDGSRERLGEELWQNFEPWYGHVVVRVYEGGESYQVFVLDAKSGDCHILHAGEIVNL